jgi:dephospho-CoA kinase
VLTDLPYRVGLTGGIGSGKSTVAEFFARKGIKVIDTDHLAHRLTASGGRAMPELLKVFGEAYVTAEGALDRVRMRQLAFSDDTARHKLEAILHPMIREEVEAEVVNAPSPYVIIVVPLLFEGGKGHDRFSRTLVVDCREEEQVRRVMSRSGLKATEVLAIMARQLSRQQRLALADDVIDNSAGLHVLEEQVEKLDARYREFAKAT